MIPMVIVLAYAFLKKGTYGGVELEFSTASFYISENNIYICNGDYFHSSLVYTYILLYS